MVALLETAATEFIARHENRSRPTGTEDSTGWSPDLAERRDCCTQLGHGVWTWPQKRLCNHCKTYLHIAQLFHVDVRELRREVARQLLERNLTIGEKRRAEAMKTIAVCDSGEKVWPEAIREW